MPAGRPKGSLNKTTEKVRRAAQQYTRQAIGVLVTIMEDGKETGGARVAAAREILDRGYGKSPLALTGPDGGEFASSVTVVHKHVQLATDAEGA